MVGNVAERPKLDAAISGDGDVAGDVGRLGEITRLDQQESSEMLPALGKWSIRC